MIATTAADTLGNYRFTSVPTDVTLTIKAAPSAGGLNARELNILLRQNETLRLDITLPAKAATVITSSPTQGQTNVPVTIQPTVVFSTSLDPATITTGFVGTVQLRRTTPSPTLVVDGTVDPTGPPVGRITFTPRLSLAEGSVYEFRISNQVKDQFGNAITGVAVSFSTEGTAAQTGTDAGPRVTTFLPPNGSSNVNPDVTILMTFDRPIDPATVNSQAVQLVRTSPQPFLPDTAGRVEVFPSLKNTFRYIPGIQLTLGSSFSLSVTDQVRDTNGVKARGQTASFTMRLDGPRVSASNPLNSSQNVSTSVDNILVAFDESLLEASATRLSNYSLTFQTKSGLTQSHPITAVTTVASPPNSVRLSIQTPLLPATTYSLQIANIQDKDGNFSSTLQPIVFTTTNLGDTTGPVLLSSSPFDGQSDVSLSPTIRLQFNEAMGAGALLTSNYTFASNAGNIGIASVQAVTGTADSFDLTPRVLPLSANTQHILQFGRLITDAVGNSVTTTGFSFRTSVGAGALLDRINSRPQDGEQTFLPLTTGGFLSPTFTREMDRATLENVANYTLTELPSTPAALSFAQADTAVTGVRIQPSSPLKPNTDYRLDFSTNLRAKDGTAMPAGTSITFKTGAFGDTVAPIVLSTFPQNGFAGASVNTVLQFTFNEEMGPSATEAASYFISTTSEVPFSPQAAVAIASPPNTVQLTLPRPLRSLTVYQATASRAIKDEAGNPLQNDASITFTTGTTLGGTQVEPFVSSTNPSNGTVNVSTGTAIIVQFSQEMNEGSLGASSSVFNASSYTLASSSGGSVALSVDSPAISPNTYRIRPQQPLRGNTTFTFFVANTIVDRFNVPLKPFSMVFSTGNVGDTDRPTLGETIPARDSNNVETSSPITLFFSEEMDVSVPGSSALEVSNYVLFETASGRSIPLSSTVEPGPSLPNTSFVLRPLVPLAAITQHTLVVSDKLQDLAGNRLATTSVTFTTAQTGTTADVTAPTVTATNPSSGASNISTTSRIIVTFSEQMRTSTVVDPDSYVLFTNRGSISISAITTADSPANTFVLTPQSLVPSASHTLLFTSALQDAAGNALVPRDLSFTTASTADVTPPQVVLSNPADGATGVDPDASLFITFDEEMDVATATSAGSYLLTTPGGSAVIESITSAVSPANTFIIAPRKPMLGDTAHSLVLTNRILDLSGNPLASITIDFTTLAVPGGSGDVTAPQVTSTVPEDGAQNVGVNTLILVTFSEQMIESLSGDTDFANSALNAGNYTVRVSSRSEAVSGVKVNKLSTPPNTFVINAGVLESNALYVVELANRLRDTAGNPLASGSFAFFTGNQDRTQPSVSGSGLITKNGQLASFVQFSERMDETSVTNLNHYRIVATVSSGTIPQPSVITPVPNTLIPGSNQREITGVEVEYSGTFPDGSYELLLSNLITDLAGNALSGTSGGTITVGAGAP